MLREIWLENLNQSEFAKKIIRKPSPERFELSRGNPMYLAATHLNHSDSQQEVTVCSLKVAAAP